LVLRNLFVAGLELWAWPTVPVMVVLLVGLFWAGHRRASALVGAGVVLATSLALLAVAAPRGIAITVDGHFRQDPQYGSAIGNSSTDSLHIYELAVALARAMPKWADDPGSLVFWYAGSAVTDSPQSTYIWRTTTVQGFGGSPEMPNLDERERAMLLQRTPRYLVVLGERPEQLAAARSAIVSLGLQPLAIVDTTLQAGDKALFVERLTFPATPCQLDWGKPGPQVPGWLGLGPCPAS
jgi:hypothetical protein